MSYKCNAMLLNNWDLTNRPLYNTMAVHWCIVWHNNGVSALKPFYTCTRFRVELKEEEERRVLVILVILILENSTN